MKACMVHRMQFSIPENCQTFDGTMRSLQIMRLSSFSPCSGQRRTKEPLAAQWNAHDMGRSNVLLSYALSVAACERL